VHTSPAQFGKVMSETKPRMAVAYHVFNDFDTQPSILEQVRTTYDGPLSLATDDMVWNVTKDDIKVRMAATDEDIWPQPSVTEKFPADPNDRVGFTDFIAEGKLPYPNVVKKFYDLTNEEFGTNIQPPQ
jgi:ribonuclease Z